MNAERTLNESKVYAKHLKKIQKRDGRLVPFEFDKIVSVVTRALEQTGEGGIDEAKVVAHMVASEILKVAKTHKTFIPTVEGCQDEVERQLILAGYVQTSKAYILYRAERHDVRALERDIPDHVKKLHAESAKYFDRNPLGYFVYLRTYANWIEAEQRRETWIETVDRYMAFMRSVLDDALTDREYREIRGAILRHEAMPSMRLLQFAGPAVEKCNAGAYNCTYGAPESPRDLAEMMYLAMQGCGDGDAVESLNAQKLPIIEPQTGHMAQAFVIPDSAEGWCDAFRIGMETWFCGHDIEFDYSQIRPAGARLKTKGGKASGPDPLRALLDYTRKVMLSRQGRRLRNIDVLDIICMSGKCVVSGGVRRTAKITLSDLDDVEIRDAKKGQFFLTHPHREVSNNSAVYLNKPTNVELLDEMTALMKSGTGERGIFNRGSLPKQIPHRRLQYWIERGYVSEMSDGSYKVTAQVGVNPCGEIILLPKEFCNLTEGVARATDDEKTMAQKVRIASIIGTFQSMLTEFHYLSPEWRQNCEDERLLGVSITGQWDAPHLWGDDAFLRKLCKLAVRTNKKYAERFSIEPSLAVTCVKPSGTVSKMVNASSGMHTRPAPYYIQRIRIAATDALFKLMRDQGVPHHPDNGEDPDNPAVYVLEFPMKAPENSVFMNDHTAIEQLEYWKRWKVNYTEHNPSTTIRVGDDEWIGVIAWIEENWDIVGGLSFLPRDNHVYRLAPEEPISKERYEQLAAEFPDIDYSRLLLFERTDETDMAREVACAGGACEII